MDALEYLRNIPRRNKDRDFLIDSNSGKTLSFDTLHQSACNIAADLERRGFQRTDRIAITLNNSVAFAQLYFACLYVGCVTVPINPLLSRSEITFILENSGAKGFVCSPETLKKIGFVGIPDTEIQPLVLLDGRQNSYPLTGLEIWDFEKLRESKDFIPFKEMRADDVMTIVYTSGTTALPKGVVHRISDMVDNGKMFTKHLGIGAQSRFYCLLAMTYVGGYYNFIMLPYVAESSVVMGNVFDASAALNFWELLQKHQVNTLWLIPSIISILLRLDRAQIGKNYCKECIQLALVGTAPLVSSVKRDFESRYGISLYDSYGLSETFFIAARSPLYPTDDECTGMVLPGVEVKILNDKEEAVPYGEEGEISVRSPSLMLGYYDAKKLVSDDISPRGWFPTGDIGTLNSKNELYVTGRKKDLIIRRGLNVSPMAVENVLYQHPAIEECAVVGSNHFLEGEEVIAVIRLAANYEFNNIRLDLSEFCKAHLAELSCPSRFIELAEFPKSTTGKIQKHKLKALIRSG